MNNMFLLLSYKIPTPSSTSKLKCLLLRCQCSFDLGSSCTESYTLHSHLPVTFFTCDRFYSISCLKSPSLNLHFSDNSIHLQSSWKAVSNSSFCGPNCLFE